MPADGGAAPTAPPDQLVVIGGAAGIGRWMCEHVLGAHAWRRVVVADAAESVLALPSLFEAPTELVHLDGSGLVVGEAPTVLVLAVPLATLPAVASTVLPALHPHSIVIDLAHDRVRAEALVAAERNDVAHIGLHALFGIGAAGADGQTFALCPTAVDPHAHEWLVELIDRCGGSVNVMTAEQHDRIMRVVQTAAHQALLTFADVVGASGLDPERDLWANRTPVFELLLALASRVLAPGQEFTTASIQLADAEGAVAAAFAASQQRLTAARAAGDPAAAVASHVRALREPFSGGLFAKVQGAATLALAAVQSSRASIAAHLRSGALIGVRSVGDRDRLHVGRVRHVTATSFEMDDLLVGGRGGAAVLSDAVAEGNARRLGIAGRAKRVEFRLGRVELISDAALDAALDEWLATTGRGCKFLVPESISGASAVRVVESVATVRSAELVTEEVRLGQRACVVRFTTRVDRSLDDVERAVQRRIDDVFRWPDGVLSPFSDDRHVVARIGFLGPAGTFSDLAARQLLRLLPAAACVDGSAQLQEQINFSDLVLAVANGSVDLGVLPIASSSTGLVGFAAVALHSHAGVEAGGVVDVPVRFDAYMNPGDDLVPGTSVYSHHQALLQCSSFIASSALMQEGCPSTADACARVARSGRGVALAAPGVGEEHGLLPVRSSVGNLAGALTRFLVLGRRGTFAAPRADDVTARSLWICRSGVEHSALPGGHFDEVLCATENLALVISTAAERLPTDVVRTDLSEGVRYVGRIPWSPRTPLVTVAP